MSQKKEVAAAHSAPHRVSIAEPWPSSPPRNAAGKPTQDNAFCPGARTHTHAHIHTRNTSFRSDFRSNPYTKIDAHIVVCKCCTQIDAHNMVCKRYTQIDTHIVVYKCYTQINTHCSMHVLHTNRRTHCSMQVLHTNRHTHCSIQVLHTYKFKRGTYRTLQGIPVSRMLGISLKAGRR